LNNLNLLDFGRGAYQLAFQSGSGAVQTQFDGLYRSGNFRSALLATSTSDPAPATRRRPNDAGHENSDGGNGPSAAQDWNVFNDNASTTTTELVHAASAPPGVKTNGNIMHVTTTTIGGCDGIYQKFVPTTATGLPNDATLFKNGSWEVLNVGNIFPPATNTIICSQHGPAEFYVASVRVSTSHEQCGPS
jgi:hypothetical protein